MARGAHQCFQWGPQSGPGRKFKGLNLYLADGFDARQNREWGKAAQTHMGSGFAAHEEKTSPIQRKFESGITPSTLPGISRVIPMKPVSQLPAPA